MDTMQECCIEWIKGDKTATVTMPSNTRLNNKLRKLAQNNNSISLVANKDGSICARIPVEWVKISPKRQVNEAQRQQAAQRMREYQRQQHEAADTQEVQEA